MTQLLNWINFKYSLKRQEASNRLREDTTPGNSGDRALCSNRWTVRGTLLQSILDNWAVFQELWDDILEGKVDSEIRGQVIRVQTQKQSFNFFFLNTTGSCFDAYRQLIFFSTIHTRHVIKVSKLQKYVFQHYKVWERKLVFIAFLKRWPQTTEKKKVSSHYKQEEAPVEFVSKFVPKPPFLSSNWYQFKLETQLKTLTHIVDGKQVAVKDAITIISSLNAPPKLLVSEDNLNSTCH